MSTQKLYLSGYQSYLQVPSMTYDRVIIDFMADATLPTTSGPGYVYFQSGSRVAYNPSGTDSIYSTSWLKVYDGNGIQLSDATDFIRPNVRMTLDIRWNSPTTGGPTFFTNGTSYPFANIMSGYIYDIKMYNSTTLLAHYDMSTGTVNDQSGNGKNATLIKGTWLKEDISPPYDVPGVTISNMTNNSFSISWPRSISIDISKYNIYQNNQFIGYVNHPTTSFNAAGLTANTLYNFKITCVDTTGNESIGYSYVIKTNGGTWIAQSPPVTNNMVYHLDLQNRQGAVYNTIMDSVGNTTATLPFSIGNLYANWAPIDNINYGWVDNTGIKLVGSLLTSAAIHASTKNSSLATMDLSQGLTIETGYRFNSNGGFGYEYIHRIAGTGGIISQINNAAYFVTAYYINKSSQLTSFTVNITGLMTNMIDGTKRNFQDALAPFGELNHFVTRLQPDGTLTIMVNEFIATGKPSDFLSWTNPFAVDDIYWGGNTNNKAVCYARIYNRALTNTELEQNYDYENLYQGLSNVSVLPSSITLNPGDSQPMFVTAVPNYFSKLVSNSFQSGNEGFVTVTNNGLATGIANGQTNIKVTTTYQSQTFVNLINVAVGSTQSPPPPPSRQLSGVAINRKIDTLEVGDHFVVMATTLPFDIMYDNLIKWVSSDPNICSVSYGVLEAKAPGTVTITVQDVSELFKDSFTLTVTTPVNTTLTPSETYNVILSNYGIMGANTNSTATTNGIINALNYASTNGYKKIVFPNATYLVTPAVSSNPILGVIKLPSNMIIDFSGSTINIEASSYTATGYSMFIMDNGVQYTKLMNANVYGEADSTTYSGSTEKCISFLIIDAYKSGIDNCTFSKSPGFNVSTGTHQVKTGTNYTTVPYTSFEAGNIDDTGAVDNTNATYRFRSKTFLDISGLGSYYLLGYTLGYWDYPYLRSRVYSIYFYDVNYNFVTFQKYNKQFYNYNTPANVKFAKIVIYQASAPTSGDGDYNGSIAFIKTLACPRDCFLLNSKFENNYSCGVAMTGGQGWHIEGNTFSGNNGRMPACDMDWEDGWDSMVGDVVKNNTFNSTLGVTTAAGNSLAFFDNTFNNSYMNIWSRSTSWRVFNNTFNGKGGGNWNIGLATQEDSYFGRNVLKKITYTNSGLRHSGATYSIHFDNNILI